MRVHRFFTMVSLSNEFKEQHIDAMHFITGRALFHTNFINLILYLESLLQMWQEILNKENPGERNSAWKGLYKTQSDVKNYEYILKHSVFDVVHQNYILDTMMYIFRIINI